MPTIEIDNEIYEFLRNQIRDFNETPSIVLRRLLKAHLVPAPAATKSAQSPLTQFISDTTFGYLHTVTEKYLAILGFVRKQNPTEFQKIRQLNGRRRVYFGMSKAEVEASGKSTNPKMIPDSNFWAMTNAATQHKREILGKVLKILNYNEGDIKEAVNSLV